jgi:4-hydroxy-tetrahydrodipicolinate synthase
MTHSNPSDHRSIIGVCPVVETPFHRSGDSDPESLATLVDRLAAAGVASVMYAGLASEMHKLADRERDELTELVIERGHSHGMTVVASVSDATPCAAARRAEHYAAGGADFINVLPPAIGGTRAASSLAHVAAVLSAIGTTPATLQLVPALISAGLDAGAVAQLARSAPNLVQVKVETRSPGVFIAEIRDAAPRLTCLVGSAGVGLPDAVRQGAAGVQPGCSAAELYLKFWRLWSDGDAEGADALHGRMHPYLSYWMQDVELIVAAEKRVSFLRGLIPTDVCRAPARTLTSEELAMVDRFLVEFGAELGVHHHSAKDPSS